jgi:phenylpropionate dioxygenase-like ring-hydroxylating dioxygenase large terminal subunit
MLFGFWYRALQASSLGRGKTAKARLLGVALLVGRDSEGTVFALHDACPHRGMPLSYGRFDGKHIECALHGWRFDARSGECKAIPASLEPQRIRLDTIRAGHVPCAERDGFVWVFLAEPARTRAADRDRALAAPGAPPALAVYSARYRHFDISAEVAAPADHYLAILIDFAHGPFVHRRWWIFARMLFGLFGLPDDGSGRRIDEVAVHYEPLPLGFRETLTSKVPDRWVQRFSGSDTVTTQIDFVLPMSVPGTVRFGKYWLSALTTVTPVDDGHCRVDQRVAWGGLYWAPFGALVMKFLFWVFFLQDKRATERQAEGSPRIPRLMFVDDCDRPARWYYEFKRGWLESRRTGGELRHPLQAPVTLRYRNAGIDGS